MKWIEITEENELPEIPTEFLTRNDNQGGTLRLLRWNSVYTYFVDKDKVVLAPQATHYMLITK